MYIHISKLDINHIRPFELWTRNNLLLAINKLDVWIFKFAAVCGMQMLGKKRKSISNNIPMIAKNKSIKFSLVIIKIS